jgi:hypothetical protein
MIRNVEENIKKARSAYGLFGGGYHGNNGLDPDTLIHLFSFDLTMSCPLAKFFSMLLSA